MYHLITCGIESLRQLIHLVAKRCVISRYIAYMEICACASVCLNVLKRCIISAVFTLCGIESLRQLIHLVAKRCVISRYIAYMEICACASVCLNVLKRCVISAFFTLGNVQIPNCKKQSPILSWEILHIPTHGLTDTPTFRQSVGRVR